MYIQIALDREDSLQIHKLCNNY